MLLRSQSLCLTGLLLISLLMMSFSVSASVVYSFSNYDVCSVDSEIELVKTTGKTDEKKLMTLDSRHSTSHCCTSLTCVWYPPSSISQGLSLTRPHTLALIESDLSMKTVESVQSLYKPPIA